MPAYRTLFRSEVGLLEDHYLRLSQADRTLRFLGGVSDEFIKAHCREINWLRACVVGCFIDGTLRGVAELHVDRAYRPTHGEVGVSVETEWQGEGIGSRLMRSVMVAARNRMVRTLSMACAPTNGAMQHVAREFAYDLRLTDGEVNADIAVPYPSILSLYDEAFANCVGLLARARALAPAAHA